MSYKDFPEERLQKIRSALEGAGYKHRLLHDGKAAQYWHEDSEGHQDADGCVLPVAGEAHFFHDTPRRGPEAIVSLLKFTGKPLLELGPLTKREEAYAALICDRSDQG